MSSSTTLTVVIPSHRRLERLAAVVARHVEQAADEVVVVLDGPHPGWQEALASVTSASTVRVLELPEHRGRALARVAGLHAATGDAVLLADDDVLPLDGLVARHREHHAARPGGALLGYMPVDLPTRRGRDDAPTWIYARDYENQVAVWRGGDEQQMLASFWGGNVSIDRRLYERAEALRPLDPLDYNEDLDLGMRLAALEARVAFDERAAGLHLHQRGLAAFLAECVVRGEAAADLEERWPELPTQIRDLVVIPTTHGRLAARLQASVGARDDPGVVEAVSVAVYRATGVLRIWRIQDAVTRFLRRGLAIRGHRQRTATRPNRATPSNCLTR